VNHIVLIESPYRNGDRSRNLRYLAWCEYDAFSRGEFPIASHGNCTAYVLEDDEHRAKGFAWRDAVRGACDAVIFYVDLGMSDGQKLAMEQDEAVGVPHKTCKLPPDLLLKFIKGEYPPGTMRRVAFAPTVIDQTLAIQRNLREDVWRRYQAVDEKGECGFPFPRDDWRDIEVLMELEARGYLPLRADRYEIVREGEQIRVERSGLVLLLTPVG
jgi:hypothetical protein